MASENLLCTPVVLSLDEQGHRRIALLPGRRQTWRYGPTAVRYRPDSQRCSLGRCCHAADACDTSNERCIRRREPVEMPVQLGVDVEPIGPVGQIFAGDDSHPALTHQDVFAFLPFQTNARRLVIPVYVMTYDVSKRMPEETYKLTIKGLDSEAKSVHLIDPITGHHEQLTSSGGAASVRVETKVTDYPRLLVVEW